MKHPLLAVAIAALAVGWAVGHASARAATATASKCPAKAPKFNSTLGTTSRFVSPGAQTLRLCRYSNATWGYSQRLIRDRLIRDGATIRHLTRAFNKLQEPPRGIFCMRDDGSEIYLVFARAGARPGHVVVRLTGCRYASNGHGVRSTTTKLHNRLLRLTKG